MKKIELYEDLYKLKRLVRSGWINRNVGNGKIRLESDAEHTFSCQFLAMQIINDRKLNLNVEKVLFMLLCHELGEGEIGDITPYDNIDKDTKYNLEFNAIKNFANKHNMPKILECWLEFEENITAEAQFAKSVDKLDAICQARIYANEFGDEDLFLEFYNNGKKVITGIDNWEEYVK